MLARVFQEDRYFASLGDEHGCKKKGRIRKEYKHRVQQVLEGHHPLRQLVPLSSLNFTFLLGFLRFLGFIASQRLNETTPQELGDNYIKQALHN